MAKRRFSRKSRRKLRKSRKSGKPKGFSAKRKSRSSFGVPRLTRQKGIRSSKLKDLTMPKGDSYFNNKYLLRTEDADFDINDWNLLYGPYDISICLDDVRNNVCQKCVYGPNLSPLYENGYYQMENKFCGPDYDIL